MIKNIIKFIANYINIILLIIIAGGIGCIIYGICTGNAIFMILGGLTDAVIIGFVLWCFHNMDIG